MTDTRALVLGRVRRALSDVPAHELPENVPVPRGYHRAGDASTGGLVERFAGTSADYRAHIVRTSAHAAPATIAKLLADRDVASCVVPRGFPAVFLSEVAGAEPVYDNPPLSIRSLDLVHGVISTCALAIAQTGTIILDGGPGQGRRALTLLPDYHLCLVRADQIVATVPDAIARLHPRRPLTMISGPSATSDIENNRVEGVHGPRTLHIVIIEPDGETERS